MRSGWAIFREGGGGGFSECDIIFFKARLADVSDPDLHGNSLNGRSWIRYGSAEENADPGRINFDRMTSKYSRYHTVPYVLMF